MERADQRQKLNPIDIIIMYRILIPMHIIKPFEIKLSISECQYKVCINSLLKCNESKSS